MSRGLVTPSPLSRCTMLLGALVMAAIVILGSTGAAIAEPVAGGTLDPTTIPKYSAPLVIPPAMPTTSPGYYEIAVRQFQQQILPIPFNPTTVWGYGSVNHPGTFNYPSFTIEARVDSLVKVKWINGLVDANGNYLPHLLPVDQTIHWANPMAGPRNQDSHGMSPSPYAGPVPMVVHVHGAHTTPESDGFAESWWLPAANNLPAGIATRGSLWDQIADVPDEQGTATFQYPNDQPAGTIWYHDHTLGMTRVNVYAGPAGFYLLRGGAYDLPTGVLPGPAPQLGDAAGTKYYEIPIAIQDRSFNADGSLFYPSNRAFFEGLDETELLIPFIPDFGEGGPSDVSPIWNPEFFGNTMVVNGKTWPYLEVEPRRYRFRLLDGTQGRFLILKMDKPLKFWQIGAEGGFLPEPVALDQLLMGPAERADVIVDFSTFQPGDVITMLNIGPDEPFAGGEPGVDFDPADPGTTGQVMQFRVVPLTTPDTSTPAQDLMLPSPPPLGPADNTRMVSLNEAESETVFVVEEDGDLVFDPSGDPFGPSEALLGTMNADMTGNPLKWSDAISETPLLNSTEIWEIYNFTMDAHPIHIHEVQFEVLDRAPMEGSMMQAAAARPPEAWETGYKDTVISYPGEITRVKAKFDLAGLYVWHCHIIEHEDNEMMRPYEVVLPPAQVSFADVPSTHPFSAAITDLASKRIMEGYDNGLFGPADVLKRAQMAKIGVLAFDKHNTATTNLGAATFPDVVYSGSVYPFDYVEESSDAGFVSGYANGSFGPFDTLTRIQMLRIIVRAAGSILVEPPAGYNPGFTDLAPADVPFVAKAKFNKLIGGKTATTFDPYGAATRGHAAQVIFQVLALMSSDPGGEGHMD
jgi:spore coat protein A